MKLILLPTDTDKCNTVNVDQVSQVRLIDYGPDSAVAEIRFIRDRETTLGSQIIPRQDDGVDVYTDLLELLIADDNDIIYWDTTNDEFAAAATVPAAFITALKNSIKAFHGET